MEAACNAACVHGEAAIGNAEKSHAQWQKYSGLYFQALHVELNEGLEEELEQNELREIALQDELCAFEPYPEEEESATGQPYILSKPSRRLQAQLETYREFKTKKLAFKRVGATYF